MTKDVQGEETYRRAGRGDLPAGRERRLTGGQGEETYRRAGRGDLPAGRERRLTGGQGEETYRRAGRGDLPAGRERRLTGGQGGEQQGGDERHEARGGGHDEVWGAGTSDLMWASPVGLTCPTCTPLSMWDAAISQVTWGVGEGGGGRCVCVWGGGGGGALGCGHHKDNRTNKASKLDGNQMRHFLMVIRSQQALSLVRIYLERVTCFIKYHLKGNLAHVRFCLFDVDVVCFKHR